MPENTNIIFFDEYKKLDKLCSEMYGKNSGGVTCYLNDMMTVPVMQRNRIPEWNQTYDRLRELRHIRNQMAHGEQKWYKRKLGFSVFMSEYQQTKSRNSRNGNGNHDNSHYFTQCIKTSHA